MVDMVLEGRKREGERECGEKGIEGRSKVVSSK